MAASDTAERARMDVFVLATAFSCLADLQSRVRRWESAGVAGILIPDHLFAADGGLLSGATVYPDPVPVLAAIGALSSRLKLGTFVLNVSLTHPALIARHFAQLAALFGGQRVIAGLGAGWNDAEFEALGVTMAPHAQRLDEFAAAIRLTKSLLAGLAPEHAAPDAGPADGQDSDAIQPFLRLPSSAGVPKLLLGGGSDRFLRIAGALADWVDFNGSSRQQRIGRTRPSVADGVRRLMTTVSDLEQSSRQLAEVAAEAGRSPAEISRSVFLDTIDFCTSSEVGEREDRLRAIRDAPDAAVGECPYVLLGPDGRMREAIAERKERLGLSAVIVSDGTDLTRVIALMTAAAVQ